MLDFCPGFRGVRILIAACRDVQFARDIGVCLPRMRTDFILPRSSMQTISEKTHDASAMMAMVPQGLRRTGVPEAASERNSSQPERKP